MTSGRYAEQTSVAPERSRAEIERILTRYGATQFIYGWDEHHAVIGFRMGDRAIRFRLELPDLEADEFRLTATRKWRRDEQAQRDAWEQAVRQRWRALALVIKAKLEAVAAGIVTLEVEFLAQTVIPDGRTVAEWLAPQMTAAIGAGQMPPLLPGPRER